MSLIVVAQPTAILPAERLPADELRRVTRPPLRGQGR
jgi:hypothetical protein